MAKKVHKDKNGNVIGVEVTGKDARKLHKEMEEEAKKHDIVPCECSDSVPGALGVPHTKQENGMWKCNKCGKEKDEFEVSIMKGESWFDREKGFDVGLNKIFGNPESMS